MPKTGASFAFAATPRRGRHSGRGKLRLIADTNVSPECGSATARNPSVTFWSRAHPLSTSSTRTRPSKPTPPWTDSVRRIHSCYPKKGAALPPLSALFLRELALSVLFSSCELLLLFWQWLPIGGLIWRIYKSASAASRLHAEVIR